MLADARDAPPTLRVLATSNVHIFYKPHRSTRWTGQTCLTNSQVANHECWMVRCSPRAPLRDLAVSNLHDINYGR